MERQRGYEREGKPWRQGKKVRPSDEPASERNEGRDEAVSMMIDREVLASPCYLGRRIDN